MTSRDLITAMLRRWYVMVVGAALSVGALYVSINQPPVYWTQYNVLLVGPAGAEGTDVLDDPVYALPPLVGVLATELNHGHPPMLTGDVDATMVGQGRLDGVQFRAPNLGTQWRPIFSANYLDVQVAGRTPDEVSAAAASATRDVVSRLEAEQDNLGIPTELRARAVPSSPDPTIYAVTGSRARTAGATGLLGASITVVLVYWLEKWRPRRPLRTVGATPGTTP
ncbi:hypothetical protein [Nocardioides sp.]|uniref:hypothetical protein n=1 Tax=Nocardioides sp. TaxID=35761 RepID=UPI00286DC214|nr:hypothetical protein [Nocardioides sp.]